MYEILQGGGLATGGFNFDAKLRRQSIDRIDLFHAHIGGIDTLARALLVAAEHDRARDARASCARSATRAGTARSGAAILDGGETLAIARGQVAAGEIDPRPVSGHQELLENARQPGASGPPSARRSRPAPAADRWGLVLGIDVSTTATKAVLIDETGAVRGDRRRRVRLRASRSRSGASRTRSCGGTARSRRSGSVLASTGVDRRRTSRRSG